MTNLTVGKEGETLAENYLKKKGYRILEKNYRSPVGEIDLVILHRGTIVFVEVKTNRHEDGFGLPQERVHARKQKQIVKAALSFIKEKGISKMDFRFDVIAIQWINQHPKIEHIENAFEANGS
ncbi:MAG: YraN family protein [Chlamydiae bacterium]|nr:YraN family protein [Chlamydiota bacterium]MBI3266031.1 YraN family protein [Chlamydiota bacterium]